MASASESYPYLSPLQMAQHYGFPLPGKGEGQKIAVISFGGPINAAELTADFEALGINPAPVVRVVDVGDIPSSQNNANSLETHLDVEVIGSLCPLATLTVYRGVLNGLHSEANTLQKALDDGNTVVSISWGSGESLLEGLSAYENVLYQAKNQGVTVVVAAGDGGSSNNRNSTGAAIASGRVVVQFPASSPHVLSCGGTMLVGNQEEVWNNSTRNPNPGGATGGGVSESFGSPSYQAAVAKNIVHWKNGKAGRVVPDVAALAASGDWVIEEEKSGIATRLGVGGTSAVAPFYAAVIALANEQRGKAGKAPLGYLNDRLYSRAAQGGLFTPITLGNNRSGGANQPGYDAQPGFDACTGWGVPIGATFFNWLVGLD